jgi:hypothetical protein
VHTILGEGDFVLIEALSICWLHLDALLEPQLDPPDVLSTRHLW